MISVSLGGCLTIRAWPKRLTLQLFWKLLHGCVKLRMRVLLVGLQMFIALSVAMSRFQGLNNFVGKCGSDYIETLHACRLPQLGHEYTTDF